MTALRGESASPIEPAVAAFFDADPNGVLLADESGAVVFANAAAAGLLGRERAAIVSASLAELLPPLAGEVAALFGSMEFASGPAVPRQVELEIVRADGSGFPADVRLSAFASAYGPLACAVLADATEPRRREREARLVAELTDALGASLTAEEVARVAVAESVRLLGAVRGSLALWSDDSETLEVVEPTGYGEERPPTLAYPLDEPSPVRDAYQSGRPILLPSHEAYEAVYPARAVLSSHRGAIAVLPLRAPAGGLVGTMNVGLPAGADLAASLPILEQFARVVGQATDRARLFSLERRARLQADALVRVTAALSAAPTLTAVARAVTAEGCRALGASGSYLVGLNVAKDGLELLDAAGFPAEVTSRWRDIPLDAPLPLAEVVRTREPIWLERAADAERYPVGAAARAASGYLAALVAPLVLDGRAIGAVSFHFPGERRFTRSERNLTLALASLAAHAFERAALFEQVERSRLMTEAIIEHVPVGITVAEAPSGRLLYANEAVERIWRGRGAMSESIDAYVEWPACRLDGRPLSVDEYPMARALRGEHVDGEQLLIRRRDGTTGFVLVSSSPVAAASGELIAGVSALVDVTERVQSEALREAFMGLLSHELRTPVTSILAASRLLASARPTLTAETRRELVSDIEGEADRLHRLVENVLVIARVERGMELEAGEPILLQHLVPRIVREERRRWPNATIGVSIEPNLPTVTGEPGYVGQILSNLLSNGIKYSPVDAQLDVVIEREEEVIAVRVLDRGIGVDPREPERLFEAFYRAPESATTASGAGIGLFVVRQLVEAMHGRVWARPRPGGGSEFGFGLPILHD